MYRGHQRFFLACDGVLPFVGRFFGPETAHEKPLAPSVREMLPRAALRCKLVQSTGGIDCTRAAIEFRPLSLFITVYFKLLIN